MNDEQQKFKDEIIFNPTDTKSQSIDTLSATQPSQQALESPSSPTIVTTPLLPSPPQQFVTGSEIHQATAKRKLIAVFGVLAVLAMLAGSAAAYFFLYYVPNKPEVLLNSAVVAFVEKSSDYEVVSKLDQAGPNDPDFSARTKIAHNGNSSTELFMSATPQYPSLNVVKNGSKVYLRFSGVSDLKTMAKSYTNYGKPGAPEAIAAFGESSGISAHQHEWIQVDDFILKQPVGATPAPAKIRGIPGATLEKIAGIETINGKQVRKYDVVLDRDAFKLMVGQLDKNAGVPILSGLSSIQDIVADSVRVEIWVGLKSRSIEQISYSGRPFKNATFSIKLNRMKSVSVESVTGDQLTSKLSYGIVNAAVFNKAWQRGGSEDDKERIADLKGIKTALELYKTQTGSYPDRYTMSVEQDDLISKKMKGSDPSIFKDPSGRYIGRNGSQYAYIPASANDDRNCGESFAPCTKFFIGTTFDDGKKYQLNSN